MRDYEQERATFTWARAQTGLDGLPAGRGLNIAHEAVDRHVSAGRGDRVTLRWIPKTGSHRDYTFVRLPSLRSALRTDWDASN